MLGGLELKSLSLYNNGHSPAVWAWFNGTSTTVRTKLGSTYVVGVLRTSYPHERVSGKNSLG